MKLSEIVIEIEGKKYAIDMDKAKELYYELYQLFGDKELQYVPYIPYQPIVPYEPYQPPQPWTPYPWTTCDPYTTISSSSTTYQLTELNDE